MGVSGEVLGLVVAMGIAGALLLGWSALVLAPQGRAVEALIEFFGSAIKTALVWLCGALLLALLLGWLVLMGWGLVSLVQGLGPLWLIVILLAVGRR